MAVVLHMVSNGKREHDMLVTRTARPIDLGHLVGVRWNDGICHLHAGHVVRVDFPYDSIPKFYACFYACYVQDTPTISLDAQELMVFLSSLQLVLPLLLQSRTITARRRHFVRNVSNLGNRAVGPLRGKVDGSIYLSFFGVESCPET